MRATQAVKVDQNINKDNLWKDEEEYSKPVTQV
jgi:hypothetical protein